MSKPSPGFRCFMCRRTRTDASETPDVCNRCMQYIGEVAARCGPNIAEEAAKKLVKLVATGRVVETSMATGGGLPMPNGEIEYRDPRYNLAFRARPTVYGQPLGTWELQISYDRGITWVPSCSGLKVSGSVRDRYRLRGMPEEIAELIETVIGTLDPKGAFAANSQWTPTRQRVRTVPPPSASSPSWLSTAEWDEPFKQIPTRDQEEPIIAWKKADIVVTRRDYAAKTAYLNDEASVEEMVNAIQTRPTYYLQFQGVGMHHQYNAEEEFTCHCSYSSNHKVPDPTSDHGCGFWAYQQLKDANRHTDGRFTLRVELYGFVVVHETGYRAQHQRVLGVRVPRDCTNCRINPREVEALQVYNQQLAPMCNECRNDKVFRSWTPAELSSELGTEFLWEDNVGSDWKA